MKSYTISEEQLYNFLINDFIINTLEDHKILEDPQVQQILYEAVETQNNRYGVCGFSDLSKIWARAYSPQENE